MYPVLELDEEGRPDVMLRTSGLSHLADRRTTVRLLRSSPLFSVRSLGEVSLRTVDLAEGRSAPQGDEEPPSAENLAAAFAEADPRDFEGLRDSAAEAIAHAVAIETAFSRIAAENRDPQQAIALDPLKEVLEQIRGIALDHARPGPDAAADKTVTDDVGTAMAPETSPPLNGSTAAAALARPVPDGEIRSRADVLKMLDRIGKYYADHEPSSPVPLLLARARGLVDKNFIDILKDLAPNGLPEATGVFSPRASTDREEYRDDRKICGKERDRWLTRVRSSSAETALRACRSSTTSRPTAQCGRCGCHSSSGSWRICRAPARKPTHPPRWASGISWRSMRST